MARIIASEDRSLRTLPSTRWAMNGSIIAASLRSARPDTALAQASRVAAVEAHPGDRRRVVAGEPVVDLEDGVGEAAPVHRADDHLAVQRAEQQQVLEHVGGAEHAVDSRSGK